MLITHKIYHASKLIIQICLLCSVNKTFYGVKLNALSIYPVKPVLRGHLWDKKKGPYKNSKPLKRVSIRIKCSMTGQEKGDLLRQVSLNI